MVELRFADDRVRADAVRRIDGMADRLEQLADRVLLYTDDGDAILGQLEHLELAPTATLVRRSSLEDVFLRLTGRSLEE